MTSPAIFVAAYVAGGGLVVFTLLSFEWRKRQNSYARARSIKAPWWEVALMALGLILLASAVYMTRH